MDPESLSTIVPDMQRRMDPVSSSLSSSSTSSLSAERATIMAHTWWVLCLNLLSNLLHIVLLWHVRSTAPANWTDRKHVLYFYTQQQQRHTNTNGGGETTTVVNGGNGEVRATTNGHGSGNGTTGASSGYSSQMSLDPQPQRRNQNNITNGAARTRDLLERMRCVPDGYDGKSLCPVLHPTFEVYLHSYPNHYSEHTLPNPIFTT